MSRANSFRKVSPEKNVEELLTEENAQSRLLSSTSAYCQTDNNNHHHYHHHHSYHNKKRNPLSSSSLFSETTKIPAVNSTKKTDEITVVSIENYGNGGDKKKTTTTLVPEMEDEEEEEEENEEIPPSTLLLPDLLPNLSETNIINNNNNTSFPQKLHQEDDDDDDQDQKTSPLSPTNTTKSFFLTKTYTEPTNLSVLLKQVGNRLFSHYYHNHQQQNQQNQPPITPTTQANRRQSKISPDPNNFQTVSTDSTDTPTEESSFLLSPSSTTLLVSATIDHEKPNQSSTDKNRFFNQQQRIFSSPSSKSAFCKRCPHCKTKNSSDFYLMKQQQQQKLDDNDNNNENNNFCSCRICTLLADVELSSCSSGNNNNNNNSTTLTTSTTSTEMADTVGSLLTTPSSGSPKTSTPAAPVYGHMMSHHYGIGPRHHSLGAGGGAASSSLEFGLFCDECSVGNNSDNGKQSIKSVCGHHRPQFNNRHRYQLHQLRQTQLLPQRTESDRNVVIATQQQQIPPFQRNCSHHYQEQPMITEQKCREQGIQVNSSSMASIATASSFGGPVCRICHSPGDKLEPLISPCRCLGTLKYVHAGCLLHWLEISSRKLRRPPHCELCGYKYQRHKMIKLRRVQWPNCSRRDKLFHALFLISVLAMIACAAVTIVCFKADRGQSHLGRRSEDLKRAPAAAVTGVGVGGGGGGSGGGGSTGQSGGAGGTMPGSTTNSGTSGPASSHVELSGREVVTLVCGILFFFAFFVAMYVQVKAQTTVYKLLVKFWSMNQEWRVDEYRREKDVEYWRQRREQQLQQQQQKQLQLQQQLLNNRNGGLEVSQMLNPISTPRSLRTSLSLSSSSSSFRAELASD